MIENIKKIISSLDNISAYKIIENKINSTELFFIKKELQMDRIKDVHHFRVTVYKDFEENGAKFRGSSTTKIHPTMSDEEIKTVLMEASFAANFVKNPYYPLVNANNSPSFDKSTVEEIAADGRIADYINSIYEVDVFKNGSINSCELFLNSLSTRIVNSEGIDVSFNGTKGQIEFIINWKEAEEEIELYKDMHFSTYDGNMISSEVRDLLLKGREKSIAAHTPNLKKFTVLLTGEPVAEFFSYYTMQASAQSIYNKISTAKLGENIQGDQVLGDHVTLSLDPYMKNSSYSEPYDEDGFLLNPVHLYKDGILENYWGDMRYCYYLNIPATGIIKNVNVAPGSRSIEDMKISPYLELCAFSDFQMDSLTGNFAGEIRLGWYFDGKTTVPVSGGSVSGNIMEVQKEFYFSKEVQKSNSFFGPKTIQLFNISIAGN